MKNLELESKKLVVAPSLGYIRTSLATNITRIVEHFQGRNISTATISEIVDGIGIENNAEDETVFSAIDPYTEGADKRDGKKPLIFRKYAPAEYEFLGYEPDALNLTVKMSFGDPLLQEAYKIFSEIAEHKSKGTLRNFKTSEKARVFHRNLVDHPDILRIAKEKLDDSETNLDLDICL